MKHLVKNTEFNQIHYPSLIGQFFDSRPKYAQTAEMQELTVSVEYDTCPMHPRQEWDNLGTISDSLSRYTLGEESHSDDFDFLAYGLAELDENQKIKVGDCFMEVWECEGDEDGMNAIMAKVEEKYIITSIHAYIHSSITISTSSFSCRWDSGQVGFIYVSKEKLREELRWKRLTKERIEKAYTYLEREVETLDAYLTGQVFGYEVKDKDGDTVESCWGFYDEKYCEEEGERMIECLMESFKKENLN